MKRPFMRYSRLAAALMVGAAAGLASAPAAADITDISQTPLASASNLAVLPNILFLLDDSGSMTFDTLPDHTERNQQGTERRYFQNNAVCKPKGILTTSSTASLNGLPATHCDRTEPPFGAVEHNGMYYNPQQTYRPAMRHDGTSYPKQTSWSSVSCDPFGTGWGCDKWYYINQDYYDNGDSEVDEGAGRQYYSNGDIKKWYDSSSNFDVQNRWPEIVFCNSTGGNVNDLAACRRNGFPRQASEGLLPDVRHTGTTFRYTTARWGRGNTFASTPAVPYSGGYPEAPADARVLASGRQHDRYRAPGLPRCPAAARP